MNTKMTPLVLGAILTSSVAQAMHYESPYEREAQERNRAERAECASRVQSANAQATLNEFSGILTSYRADLANPQWVKNTNAEELARRYNVAVYYVLELHEMANCVVRIGGSDQARDLLMTAGNDAIQLYGEIYASNPTGVYEVLSRRHF